MNSQQVGQMLTQAKIVSAESFEECLKTQRSTGKRLVDVLIDEKVTDEHTLLNFFSNQYGLTVMDISNLEYDERLAEVVSQELCVKHRILPVGIRGETLVVAISDPTDIELMDELKFHIKKRLQFVLALPSLILKQIEHIFGDEIHNLAKRVSMESNLEAEGVEDAELDVDADGKGKFSDEDAPIIRFVTTVMLDAIKKGASDIHFEIYEKDLRVRLRIDGLLSESVRPPKQIKRAIIARIKVMARLRLDERRLPQDGRIRFKLKGGAKIDFRVNTLPTIYGEKIVMRILDKDSAILSMSQIGFEKEDLKKFTKEVSAPWGMCLVTGATGSGKTTTLYTALNELNREDVNISTIEDPVEYNFMGINQCQVHEDIGLTFAEALRALLRQDPDVILLGEIRDQETAEVAMKAALTGHLVLSTLHTNDAPSTIMRLQDIGIQPFLINSALRIVVAQRLAKTNCSNCTAPDPDATPAVLKEMGFPPAAIGKFKPMRGKGCSVCRGTGIKGRAAIHEVMQMNEKLREVVGAGGNTDQIRQAAIKMGMKTLRHNAMKKVIRGQLSIRELANLRDE